MCVVVKDGLTQVTGLAVESVQLLLICPLLITWSRDDEESASPAKSEITEKAFEV